MRFEWLLEEISHLELASLNYTKLNPVKYIPKFYFKTNKEIFKNEKINLTDLEKALQIATWLRQNIIGGKGLGLDSEKTLKYMLSGGYGICSDFSQIFNNFCVINNLTVREWGLNNISFDEGGHSLNEVYSKELEKWVLIDVSNSIYFNSLNNSSGLPLSVLEVFTLSRWEESKEIIFFYSKSNQNMAKIQEYYFSKNIQPFLIDNYNNRLYDFLLKKLNFLPIPIIHGIPIILNRSYKFKLIKLPTKPISNSTLWDATTYK